jgi:hypothetical protein
VTEGDEALGLSNIRAADVASLSETDEPCRIHKDCRLLGGTTEDSMRCKSSCSRRHHFYGSNHHAWPADVNASSCSQVTRAPSSNTEQNRPRVHRPRKRPRPHEDAAKSRASRALANHGYNVNVSCR